MFGTIRKHQTWLWAIIITVIIISFVIFFSPYSRMNDNRRVVGNLGSINGEKISPEEYMKAYREICLRMFFMSGNWPDDDARKQGGDVERETFQWLLLIQKQKQLGIHISIDAAASGARAMISQFQRMGITSPDMFIRQILQQRGYDLSDLERFVRHYMGLEQLIGTVGLSGRLVPPQDIRELYKREHQEISASAAFFAASNYLASAAPPPEALTQFFTNRLASYRIPERVQVSYVAYYPSNYQAEALESLNRMTNLDAQIEEAWRQGGTNFLQEVKAQSLPDAKVKVREARRTELATQAAVKKAREFASQLFDMQPIRADNLDKLAKDKGLTMRVTEPFDKRDGPTDVEVGQDFVTKAFARTPESPFALPIVARDAVYVIAYNQKLPSEIPTLDKIRAKVEKDYQLNQALEQARKAGAAFYQTLTNGLAQGKTVDAICTEAKVHLTDLPPVSISTRDAEQVSAHLPLNQFKQIVFSTPIGKPSSYFMTAEGGVIIFPKSKLPIDEAKMNQALPAFAEYVRRNWQNDDFNMWFRREAEKGLRDTPIAKQETPPAMAPAPKAKKS